MFSSKFVSVFFAFFALFFAFFFFGTSFVGAANGDCTAATSFTVQPTTGDTNTPFSIKGTVQECNNSRVYVFGESDAGDTFAENKMTNAQGEFSFDNVVLPSKGTWKIQLLKGLQDPISSPELTVTIGAEVPKKCDDKVNADPEEQAKCPSECPATQVGSDYICKRPVTTQNSTCRTEGPQCDAPLVPEGEGAECKCILKSASKAAPEKIVCSGDSCTKAAGDFKTCGDGRLNTAIGCVPVTLNTFINALLVWTAGIAGGIAFLLMIFGSLQMVTSQGNADQLKKGREQFVAAISGLLFIIFSITLLQIIGADILGLPGFGR